MTNLATKIFADSPDKAAARADPSSPLAGRGSPRAGRGSPRSTPDKAKANAVENMLNTGLDALSNFGNMVTTVLEGPALKHGTKKRLQQQQQHQQQGAQKNGWNLLDGPKLPSANAGPAHDVGSPSTRRGGAAGEGADAWNWPAAVSPERSRASELQRTVQALQEEVSTSRSEAQKLQEAMQVLHTDLRQSKAQYEALQRQNLAMQKKVVQREIQQSEGDPLAEQVRMQLETLVLEKARLAQDNARLMRENQRLLELMRYTAPEDALGETPTRPPPVPEAIVEEDDETAEEHIPDAEEAGVADEAEADAVGEELIESVEAEQDSD